jgi:hypothetical protein
VPLLDRTLRQRFASTRAVVRSDGGPHLSARLLKQQLRGVTYSQERARRLLGYEPPVSFHASMEAFTGWYRVHYGWRDEWWALVQPLRARA